jgi:glycerol-3-phosphate dehydrogenase
MDSQNAVLILGAGINGCAIARELALNGVGVCLVDTADVASGATAYSSRLIHGGLRYLEYGEFDLVRESLAERTRLLRLAPQFVRPLKLSIPVATRAGGFFPAARRFLGFAANSSASRGMWVVRLGLWLYDRYARDPLLPRHAVHRLGAPETVPVSSRDYRWLCEYWDAQVLYPERFTVALLADAREAAKAQDVPFSIYTYHEASRRDERVEIRPLGSPSSEPAATLTPWAIINATGASVDRTLARLEIPSRPLMGPTKGSHLVTFQPALRSALAGQGVYAEADDGRPVFILPLGDSVLVGTTDIPFDEPPESATATGDELDYLLAAVNRVFPQASVSRDDIELHYAGVRPLPRVDASAPAGVTRRHWLAQTPDSPIPLYSVIGGKLTTCRSLAESVADAILTRLEMNRIADTRGRPIPGGENYPPTAAALEQEIQRCAESTGWAVEQVRAVWRLVGTRAVQLLAEMAACPRDNLDGTALPRELSRWMIRHEHARTLADLVERRLMLLYHPRLIRKCLEQLAEILVEEGLILDAAPHVQQTIDQLARRYGKRIRPTDPTTDHRPPTTDH